MKKLISALLVAAVLISYPMAVFASEGNITASGQIDYLSQEEIEEYDGLSYSVARWSEVQSITNGIVFSGTTARVVCDVQAYSSTTKITATNTLQRYSGGSWVDVRAWSGSGTYYCAFEGTATVTSGQLYRVVTNAKLYSSSGSLLETASATSKTYTC